MLPRDGCGLLGHVLELHAGSVTVFVMPPEELKDGVFWDEDNVPKFAGFSPFQASF